MAENEPASVASAKPAAKRFVFKKPDWATAPKKKAEDGDGDLFSRSSTTFSEITAERARQKHLKLARKQKAPEGRPNEGREGKRRRVSTEDDDTSDDSVPGVSSSTGQGITPTHQNTNKDLLHLTSRSLPRPSPELHKPTIEPLHSPSRKATVIDLGDSESENDLKSIAIGTSNGRASNSMSQHNDDDESDEELRELTAQARERRHLRELQSANSPAYNNPTVLKGPPVGLLGEESPDPVILLLIHSKIAGTSQLVVRLKMSKRMQEPREAWCERQKFSPELTASVFLSWRNRKIWDLQTFKSLGIYPDFNGKPVWKNADGIEEEADKIEMEAVTDEIFLQNKRNAERDVRSQDDIFDREQVDDELQEERQLRIMLRAKGYEDYKLVVKPLTTIGRIIGAFCTARKLAPDKTVTLIFDGDALNREDKVEDTEFDDMDCIEVHIK